MDNPQPTRPSGLDSVAASPAPRPPFLSSRSAPARGSVLVVDDEPTVVELLLGCLTVAGYEGIGAQGAADAMGRLREHPFDVMLCDLMLPGMNGVELMVKARLEVPDMAILMVTAVSDIDTAVRAMRLGAYDYLIKPVSPGDVVLHVSSAMETRRHLRDTRIAQERLEESYGQLQGLVETKDNLVQMLVHDLKSPLASAMGYMELMERKAEGSFSERHLGYLQRAYTSCKDVLRMTATMLDVTRLEQGVLKPQCVLLDLPALLREAAAEIDSVLAASGGSADVECPAALQAFGDPELVRRILGNLLSNAAKHTPPGSHVHLAACTGDEKFVVVSVADNGPGIPAEERERIFEKFYQLEGGKKTGGAGIGLAFCKMAIEAHGGRIWVESTPGRGSIFRFTLPAR
jgi:two-component system, sensor histidine kinase and response regulator